MEIAALIHETDRLKAELDALRPLPADTLGRVNQKIRLEWNYHSNAIEGNSLDLGETKMLIMHGLTAKGKPLKDHLDIQGHNDVVLWLEDIVNQDTQLTQVLVREMHKALLKEPSWAEAETPDGQQTRKLIEIGKYKTSPNHVRTATGEIFRYATPEETPIKMMELLDWYNEEEEKIRTKAQDALHPLVFAVKFHYDFVRIHPFDDGNGRMSRILMNLILMRHGYPPAIVRTEKREAYIAALEQADVSNDLSSFVIQIGLAVKDTLELMLRAARGESIEEMGDWRKRLKLLDASIETSPGEKLQKRLNVETYKTLYKNLARALFKEALQISFQFNKYFLENYHIIYIDNSGLQRQGINADEYINDADKQVDSLTHLQNERTSQITLMSSFNSFKKDTSRAEQQQFKLIIKLEQITYSVELYSPEYSSTRQYYRDLTPKVLYHSSLSSEMIGKILDEWGTFLTDHLEKLTDKSLSPDSNDSHTPDF